MKDSSIPKAPEPKPVEVKPFTPAVQAAHEATLAEKEQSNDQPN